MKSQHCLWNSPPEILRLVEKEVHIWRIYLDQPLSHTRELRCVLSADERARAERFHFSKDRDRYITCHGLLRTILGRYLDRRPSELRFRFNSYGKPYLDGEFGSAEVHFNLSHSGALALCAIAYRSEIGIDIECIRPDLADMQTAKRYFSAREVAALRATPVDQQPETFFTYWTCKEAYIKARGEGLSVALDQFTVSLTPEEPGGLIHAAWDSRETARWSLLRLTPQPDYAAALVVEGHDWQARRWQCPAEDFGANS